MVFFVEEGVVGFGGIVEGETVRVTATSLGNPHCAVFLGARGIRRGALMVQAPVRIAGEAVVNILGGEMQDVGVGVVEAAAYIGLALLAVTAAH